PQDAGSGGLGGRAPGANRGVLSAGLFTGVEPGGVFEQRHEGHAQRSQPATRPANIAGPVVGIHETLDSGARTCDKLLSASVDSICGSRGIGLIFLRAGVICTALNLGEERSRNTKRKTRLQPLYASRTSTGSSSRFSVLIP